MAQYEFTAPDGQKYRITAPEGATEEDAFAMLQSQIGAAPAAPEPEQGLGATIVDRLKRFPTQGILGVLDLPGANLAEAANRGALSWLPDVLTTPGAADRQREFRDRRMDYARESLERDKMGPLAQLILPDLPLPERPVAPEAYTPGTIPEKFAYGAGEALPVAAGGLVTLATKAPQMAAAAASRAPGAMNVVRRLGHGILESFKRSPKAFTATEAAAGGAGRVGADLAAEEGGGPLAQAAAGTAAAVAAGVAPSALATQGRRLAQTVIEKATPFIPGGPGAQARAAKELQKQAADPAAAAAAARAAPEGVTGAQATGDPRLMQLQSKVDNLDPVGQVRRADALQGAEETTLDELNRLFGEGVDPAAWQRSVVQRGAPEGATITAGPVDQMMREAESAFEGAYEVAKGFPISTRVMREAGGDVPLVELLMGSVSSRGIVANKKWRQGVADFLQGQYDDMLRRSKDGLLKSEDLLDMRSNIRAQIRARSAAAKSGNNSRAAAEVQMFENAEQSLTAVLESQLPDAASQALRQTDARYADFKTVEEAVFRSGEAGLTAEKLGAAVRSRAPSRGQVARGETGELGALASQGRDASKFYGKPQEAERVVREMTPGQASTVRSSYKDEMVKRASAGGSLRGDKLLKELDDQRETLKALGYTDADMKRIERIGKTLQMVQRKAPTGTGDIVTDGPGVVMRLVAQLIGARAGGRAARVGGGRGSSGPQLVLAGAFSKVMRDRLKDLTVDEAENLIIKAMEPTQEGRELFAALLTRSTDSVQRQKDAAGMIHAYLAPVAAEAIDEDEQ